VYQYLAPGQAVVSISGSSGGSLDRQNAMVAGHLRLACVQLLDQLRRAGLEDDAARLRGQMIAELAVPADWLVTR
jgi:hypothetical protein